MSFLLAVLIAIITKLTFSQPHSRVFYKTCPLSFLCRCLLWKSSLVISLFFAALCASKVCRSSVVPIHWYCFIRLTVTSLVCIMEGSLSQEQTQQRVVKKSSNSVPKTEKNAANSSGNKRKGPIQKRSSKSSTGHASRSKRKTAPTKKDQQMNRFILWQGGLPNGTKVFYKNKEEIVLIGYKKNDGIFCNCCKQVVSPSKFEDHAGYGTRKKPYENIFLSVGDEEITLHQYAAQIRRESERMAKKNDVICGKCERGGEIMPCHGCPRSFHKECVPETILSSEKWFCMYCLKSMKCLDEKTKLSIRIIDNSNSSQMIACVLCRAYDFNETDFDDKTVIVCDQCEKEFHIGCLRENGMDDLKELPAGNWFCSLDCEKIHYALKDLVNSGMEKVPDSLVGLLNTNFDVKWIVLCGKDALPNNQYLLKEAVDIFHECFNPIIDIVSKLDFIPSMAYGKKMGDSDFAGVHCAMLMKGSKVITVGLFRIFGQEVAEFPLVATRASEQGKGFFKLFLNCFERMLSYLDVKRILLPAAKDVKPMWTKKFGFREVHPLKLKEYKEIMTSMVAFNGTMMLEKVVCKSELTFQDGVKFNLSL